MTDWITPPTFVTDDPLRAEDFQRLWHDLYQLKTPLLAAQFNTGGGNTTWPFTVVGSWVDIDTSAYQCTFESQGNPLLVKATLRATHSVGSGDMWFRFTLDGVGQGGGAGQGYHRNLTSPETRTMLAVIEADAGEHTIGVQVNNQDTGTTSVYQYQCHGLTILEF